MQFTPLPFFGHGPINNSFVERLVRERKEWEENERLLAELALRLVDAGYRTLAAKLQPDVGGSDGDMAHLNLVGDVLKTEIQPPKSRTRKRRAGK